MARKRFKAIEWYKRHTDNKKLNKKNLRSLTGFLLIWSVLEREYFTDDNHLTPQRLVELGQLANEQISADEYLRFLQHFRDRYFKGNLNDENLFNALNLNDNYEDFVKNTVKDCAPSVNIIPTLLLIANRYRNNFVHGLKEPIKLHLYEKQFDTLNKFLTKFLDETSLNIRINRNRFNILS